MPGGLSRQGGFIQNDEREAVCRQGLYGDRIYFLFIYRDSFFFLLFFDKYMLFFFVVSKITFFFAYRKTINAYRKTK